MSSSVPKFFDDRGPYSAPPVPGVPGAPPAAGLPRLSWKQRFAIYLALQIGGAVALTIAWLLISALAPLFGGGRGFLRQWGTSFIVVPLTFVPVLVAWHGWALRSFGKRGGFFRLVAELAFASELIGCALIQRIA